MVTFYFEGHNFEYEVRNTFRIFDLNSEYDIKHNEPPENNDGLGVFCSLRKREHELIGYAALYNEHEFLYESKLKSSDIQIEKENERKLEKLLVIKTVYEVLSKYYNFKSDYGILTGVRPVKILFTAKTSGRGNDEINDILEKTYEISPDKIKLLWDVSNIEEKYINKEINHNNYNLYIGIPFCPSKCSYCSFTSYVNKDRLIDKYIKTLIYEIESTIEMAINSKLMLNSIYIGGGTPSVLNKNQINAIFEPIRKYYDLSSVNEITFEAGRSDTITEEKLLTLKDNFVTRISINPQTMNQNTLDIIGRKHSITDIIEKYELARKIDFSSINMDIILGLPHETKFDAEHTINEILKLRPDNITVHSLSYKTGSELKSMSGQMLLKDYEVLKSMHESVDKKCLESGYKPYYLYRQKNIKGNLENIGYTVPNKESIYNIAIIEEIETILACGAGVSSKIMVEGNKHEPIYNFKGIEEYIKRIEELLQKKKMLLNHSDFDYK